jgi:hypothetical protein
MSLTTLYLLGHFQLSHNLPIERIGAVRLMIALVSQTLRIYRDWTSAVRKLKGFSSGIGFAEGLLIT